MKFRKMQCNGQSATIKELIIIAQHWDVAITQLPSGKGVFLSDGHALRTSFFLTFNLHMTSTHSLDL